MSHFLNVIICVLGLFFSAFSSWFTHSVPSLQHTCLSPPQLCAHSASLCSFVLFALHFCVAHRALHRVNFSVSLFIHSPPVCQLCFSALSFSCVSLVGFLCFSHILDLSVLALVLCLFSFGFLLLCSFNFLRLCLNCLFSLPLFSSFRKFKFKLPVHSVVSIIIYFSLAGR